MSPKLFDEAALAILRLTLAQRHRRMLRQCSAVSGEVHDLATPRTVNDKIQWRKIFDRGDFVVMACDKLAIRHRARRMCPDAPLPDLFWDGDDPAAIPDPVLRRPGVLKQSNACGRTIFLGPDADPAAIRATCRRWLAEPYGGELGEWAYARNTPRLLIEEYVGPPPGGYAAELSVDVAGGRVLKMALILDKTGPAATHFQFDAEGRPLKDVRLDVDTGTLHRHAPPDLPACFPEAARHAVALAQGCEFVRVDFHVNDGRLHLCEMTVYLSSGTARWSHPGFARARDEAWDLRQSWFLTTPQTGWRRLYAGALRRRLDRDATDRVALGGPSPFDIAAFMVAWPDGWATERPVVAEMVANAEVTG